MEQKQKITLYRIIISAVILGITFIPAIGNLAKLPLCIAAYLIIGGDILWRSIKNISHGEIFDENFLMSIATLGALAIGEYPEAVAVMLFYQFGELFQDIAVDKSRKSITSLMDIRPDYANIEIDGNLQQVDPENVNLGDIIVIKPGEKIPLDGIITNGTSSLNTTALTGESLPRDVKEGDKVISGCINMSGLIYVKTTSTFKESTVSKILNLVENSEEGKANTEKFITRFAHIYTPIVVIAAICLAVLPPLISAGEWLMWLNRALIFLVISCPCALVVSIPLTFFAGIGGASKYGTLVKGSNHLEALSKLETMVFDKTGTLTKGSFTVTAVHPEIISENKLLKLAAMAESYSDHPISSSLQNSYNCIINKDDITEVENFSGYGIKAVIDNKTVYAGNSKLMDNIGVSWKDCSHKGTIIHIASNNQYLGHIVISDEIKPQSKKALEAFKKAGIRKTVMLSGDRIDVSNEVAEKLNIDEFHAELLPSDKVLIVEKLLKEKERKGFLAFIGDGINDAPVLKRADIGIAMGALGSDAAIEAADIVLMDDNLEKISSAIKISRKTLKIVKQNISFVLSIKILMLLLGALGIANMWEAVFADVGVSFIAILNALRAMKIKN